MNLLVKGQKHLINRSLIVIKKQGRKAEVLKLKDKVMSYMKENAMKILETKTR